MLYGAGEHFGAVNATPPDLPFVKGRVYTIWIMKKYTLFSFIFIFSLILLGFNTKSVSAYDSGCSSTGPYSTTTGQLCNTAVVATDCKVGDLFSSLTGQPCSTSSTDTSTIQAQIASLLNTLFNRELAVGSKGNDVKALQQLLKNAGFLSGKVDGSFGPITKGALIKYQNQNNITATGKTDANTMQSIETMPISALCPVIDSGVPGISSDVCPQTPIPPVVIIPPVPCPVNDSGVPGVSKNCTTAPINPPQPPVSTSSIAILSPLGGEQWTIGSTHTITWNTSNLTSAPVSIGVLLNGIESWTIASAPGNSGSYQWTIGGAKHNSPGRYQIIISTEFGCTNSMPGSCFGMSGTSNPFNVTSSI